MVILDLLTLKNTHRNEYLLIIIISAPGYEINAHFALDVKVTVDIKNQAFEFYSISGKQSVQQEQFMRGWLSPSGLQSAMNMYEPFSMRESHRF